MKYIKDKPKREPTIALINVVFLMLVFFMVAGTISQPLDEDLKLIDTKDLEGREPPYALVLHSDGTLSYRNQGVTGGQAYLALRPDLLGQTVRIVPDRGVAARSLLQVSDTLRAAGAHSVVIVTERAVR